MTTEIDIIVNRVFDKKFMNTSEITVDDYFKSKIEGEFTPLQQELQINKQKKEESMRSFWMNELSNMFKERGLKMHLKSINQIPIYTLENLKGIKQVVKNDDMKIILVYARHGKGKSTLAIPFISCMLDSTFNTDRIIFGREACAETIGYIKRNIARLKGKARTFTFDEGTDAFFSGDSSSSDMKNMFKDLSMIREGNPILIINSTSIKKFNKDIRDEFVDYIIKVPAKGVLEFYNKDKINKIVYTKDGAVKWPKPNFKENFPKVTGNFWNDYIKKKIKYLSGSDNNIIENYTDAVKVLALIENPIEKLILLLHFEGIQPKEMRTIKRRDYKPLEGFLNGRRLKQETKEALEEYLLVTKSSKKHNRVSRLFPEMNIKDFQDMIIKLKNDFN